MVTVVARQVCYSESTASGSCSLPGVFCCGLRVVSVDGSTSELCRRPGTVLEGLELRDILAELASDACGEVCEQQVHDDLLFDGHEVIKHRVHQIRVPRSSGLPGRR
jgi:hypothetical protein